MNEQFCFEVQYLENALNHLCPVAVVKFIRTQLESAVKLRIRRLIRLRLETVSTFESSVLFL